jgi:hypothetical protein
MDMNFDAVMPVHESDAPPAVRLIRMARAHTTNLIRTRPFRGVVWEGAGMHRRGATTPRQRQTLAGLAAYRDRHGGLFKTVLAECAAAGELAFANLSIANQLMLMALNSPIVWYSPRPGDGERGLANVVGQVVAFAMRGLGYKGELPG